MTEMTNISDRPHSREAELDRLIDDLIGKIVSGDATDKNRAKLQEYMAHRAKLMSPSFPDFEGKPSGHRFPLRKRA